jgi:hypothetical protein
MARLRVLTCFGLTKGLTALDREPPGVDLPMMGLDR